MVVHEARKPLLKSLPIIADTFERIQRYGADNIYPQRGNEVIQSSHILFAVVNRVADFLNGEGFADHAIASLRLNDFGLNGMTANDVLAKISVPMARYQTIPLHVNYDLNYRIASVFPVPFEFLRLGLQNSDGEVEQFAYSTNWERDSRKDTRVEREIIWFDIFDPRPEVIESQIIKAGGIDKYKGQIFYDTPEYCTYPFASFHPVFNHAQAQADLSVFKLANIQNQFLSTLAIIWSGEFESEQERTDFRNLIANKSGAAGAGTRIGLQDKSGLKKASDIFANLTPTNLDRLYELTEKLVADAIMENEAMPKELIGVRPETGMFNQENMEQAYIYFNAITRNRRSRISRAFSTLMKHWNTPIENKFEIIEQQYVVKPGAATPGAAPIPGQPAQAVADPNQDAIDAMLRGLKRADLAKFWGYVNDYKTGRATLEQIKVFLKAFKLTDEQIMLFLNDPEGDGE